ncbi:DUF2239 family protein [Alteromonas sp. 1_MG-2023]|uniref:DUF2239 family protein n=1 Tax=Alteromonas sp. 1_MG-2023 TaxID=3062669 RepID=UPI0026E18551|nr:DUF2239 family protein [Alteromonas sp. 1_MG-2023]MDO6476114.1 DUF2239 family protein [Alteromonas sp. 1_MG-2023]
MGDIYIAIHNKALIAQGELPAVIRETVKQFPGAEPYLFKLDDGKRTDIDWRGDAEDVISRLPASLMPQVKKRGRPKLGVKSKEVTLLPEHWEWLSLQRGGASTTLRKLIDAAMAQMTPEQERRIKQDQLYNMMRVFEDEAGFEAASRALYRLDETAFTQAIANWPQALQAIYKDKFTGLHSTGKDTNDGTN